MFRKKIVLMFPPQIILVVGTKLQFIITEMGLRIQERGDVVKGIPVVQPGDDLFWFNRPRVLLYLIQFVLFQVFQTSRTMHVICVHYDNVTKPDCPHWLNQKPI